MHEVVEILLEEVNVVEWKVWSVENLLENWRTVAEGGR